MIEFRGLSGWGGTFLSEVAGAVSSTRPRNPHPALQLSSLRGRNQPLSMPQLQRRSVC